MKTKKVRPGERLSADLRARIAEAGPGARMGTEVAIAKAAGVSRMTVRKAVGKLVEEGLVERRAGVGLFVAGAGKAACRYRFLAGNLLWDMALRIASGFRREMLAAGAEVDLADAQCDARRLVDLIEELPSSGLSGAAVVSSHDDALAAAAAAAQERGFPVVVIDQAVDGVPCVVSDNRLGGALAAERLLHVGHERLAFVGDFAADTVRARADGFRTLCEAATGVAPQMCDIPGVERFSDWGDEVGAAVCGLMRRKAKPTAIFCSCDAVARYALRALEGLGCSVPGDVSLVGFDDDAIAEWTAPALTTIRQDFPGMGAEAARLLLRKASPTLVTLPVSLVPRESVAGAKRGPSARPVRGKGAA